MARIEPAIRVNAHVVSVRESSAIPFSPSFRKESSGDDVGVAVVAGDPEEIEASGVAEEIVRGLGVWATFVEVCKAQRIAASTNTRQANFVSNAGVILFKVRA